MLKPLIPYTGGKKDSCEMVLPFVPLDTKIFLEPFCGGIGLSLYLLQTRPFDGEVICSDLDEHLINFYEYVKYNSDRFATEVCNVIKDPNLLLYLQEEERYLSPACFFLLKNCNTMTPPYRVVSKVRLAKYIKAFNEENFRLYIEEMVVLLNRITFKYSGYKDIVDKYKDKEGTFFFFDPPYRDNSIEQINWYNENFLDMGELYENLKDVKHWIMSYGESEFVEVIFSDYTLKRKQIFKTYSGVGRFDVYYYKL